MSELGRVIHIAVDVGFGRTPRDRFPARSINVDKDFTKIVLAALAVTRKSKRWTKEVDWDNFKLVKQLAVGPACAPLEKVEVRDEESGNVEVMWHHTLWSHTEYLFPELRRLVIVARDAISDRKRETGA